MLLDFRFGARICWAHMHGIFLWSEGCLNYGVTGVYIYVLIENAC